MLWMYYHAQKVDPLHVDRYWLQKFEDLKIHGADIQALQKYMDQWEYLLDKLPATYLRTEPIMEMKFRQNALKVWDFADDIMKYFDNFVCEFHQVTITYASLRDLAEKYFAKHAREKQSKDGSPKVLRLMQTSCGMALTQAAIPGKKSGRIEKCEIACGRVRVHVNPDLRTPTPESEMTTHGVVADIAATARTADALSIVDAATAQSVQRETAVHGCAAADASMATGATTTTTPPRLGTIEGEHAEQREFS